jgi:hypothetical protein
MKRPTTHPTLVFPLGGDRSGLLAVRPVCRCTSPQTDCRCLQSCPVCGAALVLDDDGSGTARVACCSCEYADTWTVTDPARSPR